MSSFTRVASNYISPPAAGVSSGAAGESIEGSHRTTETPDPVERLCSVSWRNPPRLSFGLWRSIHCTCTSLWIAPVDDLRPSTKQT